ncbi:MAG: hypothetical protein AAGD13_05295 [Pseudomonadota bacterium]
MDEQLVDKLPPGGLGWIRETLSAHAPELTIPDFFPPAGGMMMVSMLRLSEAGIIFPLQDPRQLLEKITQAAESLEANLAPQMRALGALKSDGFDNLAIAARLTLALRAKGVCPTTLAGIDVLAEYVESTSRVQAVEKTAEDLSASHVQPFRLSADQLALAQTLAGFASYLDAAKACGLPDLSDPDFIEALKAQVSMLAAMPPPKLELSPVEIGMIADLDNIHRAFGEDALTPANVTRVNALLNAIAEMEVHMPADAEILAEKLIVTPALQHVRQGLKAFETGGAAIAASAAVSAPTVFGDLPIIAFIERAAALSSVLELTFGKPALLPCNDCLFPIDKISANLSQVTVPDLPLELVN